VAHESGLNRVVGRYALYEEIAAGGMATVHFGRLLGPVGFSRTVAIKCLHPQFAKDPEFVSMFLDEARLAARISHPNVVQTLDVVATQGELFLVMDYVQGESLSRLIRAVREARQQLPLRIVTTIMSGALHGLHAAHEAKNERGEPLGIVHRDISPQNILVGSDGVARVLDFGVAKAAGRIQTTRAGQLKGKLSYMAPEQLSEAPTRQTDIFAAAIVLWEALTARRLFSGDNDAIVIGKLTSAPIAPPSSLAPDAVLIDAIVMRGLQRDPARRWATARDFALALERAVGVAAPSEVGEYVEMFASSALRQRASKIAEIESSSAQLQSNVPSAAQIAQGRLSATATMPAAPQRYPSSDTLVITGHAPAQEATVAPIVGEQPSLLSPESPSQLSSISVSRAGLPSAPNRGWWLAGVAAAVVVAVGAAVVGLRSTKGASEPGSGVATQATDAASFVATTPAVTVAVPTPDAQSAWPAPIQPPAPIVPHTAATHPRPSTPATATATTPLAQPSSAHSAAASPGAAKARSCDPPYTLDSAGNKKWKPECL
jgi:serine/threonine-protein kinase